MPFSEKKGRFLVTSEAPASGSPSASAKRSEKPVKRGRFLVTHCLPCVPCVLSPTASTLSDDGDSMHLLALAEQPCPAQRSESFDSSPCKDQARAGAGPWSSNTSSERQGRRVRFSEPGSNPAVDCCAAQSHCSAYITAAAAAAEPRPTTAAANAAPAAPPSRGRGCRSSADDRPFLPGPSASLPTPISTRSYCRGRFVVQEAVIAVSMTRSLSLPEHCTLAHYQPHGSTGVLYQPSDSSSSSSSSNSSSDTAAPAGLPHASDEVSAAVAAAASSSYWAATSAVNCQQQHLAPLTSTLSDELYGAGKGPTRHHRALHRSQSVSYVRRGRFLVQTTYA